MKTILALFVFFFSFFITYILYTVGFGMEVKSWPTIIFCWIGLMIVHTVAKALE